MNRLLYRPARLGVLAACLTALMLVAPARAQTGDEQLKADLKLFADAKLASDDDALKLYFKKRIPTAEDNQRLGDIIKKLGSTVLRERQQSKTLIIKEGPIALPELRKMLRTNPELETRQRTKDCIRAIEEAAPNTLVMAGARILGARRAPGAAACLLEFLPTAADPVVEEELDAVLYRLARLDAGVSFLPPHVSQGHVDTFFLPFLKDKEPSRRSIAALVTACFGDAEQRRQVQPLLTDGDVAVRFRAAQGLVISGNKAALKVAVDLLKDSPLEVGLQAEDMLSLIAAEKSPQVYMGETAESRGNCHAAWKEWLEKNENTIDLASAEMPVAFGGLAARATKGATAFINAIVGGNLEAIKRTVDVPFTFAGQLNFSTRAELDEFLKMIQKQGAQPKPVFSVTKVVPGVEYIKTGNEVERAFLEKARVAQMQVVLLEIQEGSPQKVALPVFIRLSGGKALCLGIGLPRM